MRTLAIAVLLFGGPVLAQEPEAEMTTRDEPATFKARANLVLVPVVVRDLHGRALGTLQQEQFQLFDKGKPQVVSRFSVERTLKAHVAKEALSEVVEPKAEPGAGAAAIPERFVAFLFDDVHLRFPELVRSRDAASRHIESSLGPADRAAVFSTSGQTVLDFTDDRAALRATLLRLRPSSSDGSLTSPCPDVSYFMADRILNKDDAQALQAVTLDAIACMHLDGPSAGAAAGMVQMAVMRALQDGSHESRLSLSTLKDVIRRISAMPGRRSVILVSPGFFTIDEHRPDVSDVMDRATRANVVIGAFDARGLYTDRTYDATTRFYDPVASQIKARYDRMSAMVEGEVLGELADATGGAWFHDNNDLDEGFRRIAAVPEYVYVLGFSPQNLKLDGSFHTLKVTVKNATGVTLQARRGYYAPRSLGDPLEQAQREIEEAVFSREELRDLSLDFNTQFFKSGEDSARLTVIARIGLKQLPFRQVEGRNRDELTIVSGLFDRNGNLVQGIKKTVEMRLRDDTLQRRPNITVRTAFENVKPGAYVVRLVVRDREGQLMAAENGVVEIPY
jgi:VWFA-related protein